MTRGLPRQSGRVPAWGAGLGFGAAVGLLVALRAVASLSPFGSRTRVQPFTTSTADLGIEWTQWALRPADFQLLATDALIRTLSVVVVACCVMSLLNAVILLAESASARRRETSIRFALGAAPRRLVSENLRRIAVLGLAATSIGLVTGLIAGFALRQSWPGALLPWSDSVLGLADLALLLGGSATVALGAQLSGLGYVARPGRACDQLRAGRGVGAHPRELFVRSVLSVSHIAIAATALLVPLVLRAQPDAAASSRTSGDYWVLETDGAASPDPDRLTTLAAIEGVNAATDSAPGALLGLGIRDLVVTECGNCSRGLFPAPLWNEVADHFAVGPGWFEAAGVELLEGRDFTHDDGAEAPLVAVVDRWLGNTAFEGADPIGRRLRVGSDHERWYTVVGVVESHAVPVLGEDGRRGAVYLSTGQATAQDRLLVLSADEEALPLVEAALAAGGAAVRGVTSLTEYRERAAKPAAWLGSATVLLALLAAVLAAHGSWATARQMTRRRARDVAVRRALGATSTSIVRWLLVERLQLIGWGLFGFALLGTTAVALLGGAGREVGLSPFLTAGGWVALLSLGAALHATWEATRLEPAQLLD